MAFVAVVRLLFYHMVGFHDLSFRIYTISLLLLHAEGDLLILNVDYFVGAPRTHITHLSLSNVQQR